MKGRKMLSVGLTAQKRKEMAARWHFLPRECGRIDFLYEAMLPMVKACACYVLSADGRGVCCAVTLGEDIDKLQELYAKAGAVTETYMLECLGSSLLEQAYEQLGRVLYEETGRHLLQYQFPGSELALTQIKSMLEELERELGQLPVRCNEALALIPSKSVVFFGVLGISDKQCGLCDTCSQRDCEGRKAGQPGAEKKAQGSDGFGAGEKAQDADGSGAGKKAQGADGSGAGEKMQDADSSGAEKKTQGAALPCYSYGYQRIFGTAEGRKRE